MSDDKFKAIVMTHVSHLRELSKDADDLSNRLSQYASELEDNYRNLSRETILDIPIKLDPTMPVDVIRLGDDDIQL